MVFWDSIFGKSDEQEKEEKFAEFDKIKDETYRKIKKAAWLTHRGNYYGEQNNLDEAIENFNEALSIKPDYSPAYASLIIAYNTKQDINKSIELFNDIISKDISKYEKLGVYQSIISTYIIKKDPAGVIKHAKKMLELMDDEEVKKQYVKSQGDNRDFSMGISREMLEGLIKEMEMKNT